LHLNQKGEVLRITSEWFWPGFFAGLALAVLGMVCGVRYQVSQRKFLSRLGTLFLVLSGVVLVGSASLFYDTSAPIGWETPGILASLFVGLLLVAVFAVTQPATKQSRHNKPDPKEEKEE
jgi:drug/metabolite transporter (DMT)-like permease